MASDPNDARSNNGLTRPALERVLARAAELQTHEGNDDGAPMTEAQLLELGKEVGLSADALRQALAEERAQSPLPDSGGFTSFFTGTRYASAARTVPGTPTQVLATLDALMQRQEQLIVKRRFTDQLVWESRKDLIASLRRGLALDGHRYDLARATDVSGIVAAVGSTKTHVRLVADFRDNRETRTKGAIGGSIAMLITGAPLVVIGVAPVLAAIPPILLAGAVLSITRRQYRKSAHRAQVALEQALDHLEFGTAKPVTAGAQLLDALTNATRLPR